MFHYQENGPARFTCTLSVDQSMDALDAVLNKVIINGIAIYKDSACTQSFWSNSHNFAIENVSESYSATDVEPAALTKYVDLKIC